MPSVSTKECMLCLEQLQSSFIFVQDGARCMTQVLLARKQGASRGVTHRRALQPHFYLALLVREWRAGRDPSNCSLPRHLSTDLGQCKEL